MSESHPRPRRDASRTLLDRWRFLSTFDTTSTSCSAAFSRHDGRARRRGKHGPAYRIQIAVRSDSEQAFASAEAVVLIGKDAEAPSVLSWRYEPRMWDTAGCAGPYLPAPHLARSRGWAVSSGGGLASSLRCCFFAGNPAQRYTCARAGSLSSGSRHASGTHGSRAARRRRSALPPTSSSTMVLTPCCKTTAAVFADLQLRVTGLAQQHHLSLRGTQVLPAKRDGDVKTIRARGKPAG